MFGYGKTVLAAAALLVATSVNAATVSINGGGTVTCDLDCSVLVDESGTFGDPGNLFTGPSGTAYGPGNPVDQEVEWLNDVVGGSYSESDATKTDGGDGYITSALYVILKLGNDYTILRNDSGGDIEWSYVAAAGAGAGLSHSTTVGVVPLPAAGFLLLAGLGGLALVRRRG